MGRERSFEEILPGEEHTRAFEVTGALVTAFAELTGDTSPIHVDAEAARARGFGDRVAHGALLSGLVSAVVGTELPGARGLLHSLEMKFKRPCLVGQRVRVTLRVAEKVESVRVLILDAVVAAEDGTVLARGKVQSGMV
jgi:3-hydroxybutyryl-CoA dehydratase